MLFLLEKERFRNRLSSCWERIASEYKLQHDVEQLGRSTHFREDYSRLFRDDLENPHAVKVWESFSLWWWADYGVRAYMDRYTGLFMPDLTERIYDGFYENNIAIDASQSMYIMLLFKQPAGMIPSNSRQL